MNYEIVFIGFLTVLALLTFAVGIVAIYTVTKEIRELDREVEEWFEQERARKERALLERIKSGKGIQ